MPKYDLETWLQTQKYPPATANLIRHIVNSPPSRRVRSNGKNVSGHYPSNKRGETIQFESHKNELCCIVECEHGDNVLDYFDQPPQVTVRYKTAAGRNCGHDVTPDFFVIRQDSAGWIECKTVEELEKLSKENPNMFSRDVDGKWHYHPGEEYAKQYNLFYEVYSSDQIDWIRQRNFSFLEDYLRDPFPKVAPERRDAIIALVKSKTGITLAEVLREPRPYAPDDVYTLVAIGELFIDLSKYPIVEMDKTHLFIDQEMARAYSVFNNEKSSLPAPSPTINISIGASLMWDGIPWQIINVGNNLISLQSASNHFIELPNNTFYDLAKEGKLCGLQVQRDASEAQMIMKKLQTNSKGMRKALKKYDAIVPFLNGSAKADGIKSNRSITRNTSKYKSAQKMFGEDYGLIGLFDKDNLGNPREGISEAANKLITRTQTEFYETGKEVSKKAAYGYFLVLCEKEGVKPVSPKTFRKYLSKDRPRHEVTCKRKGDRAAYKDEPFYFYLGNTIPRHGDRPFEICHIDHTESDVEVVSSETNMLFGRPHVTFLTDARTRRDLAFYLTFNEPSYVSCMMVLRECVARYGRLPQIIVVDGGPEFHGTEFETLLANYQITPKWRPGAKARFGSTCERLFGTTNTEFFHNLDGSTKIMKNVRQVTKKNNPKNKAIWTIEELHRKLENFLYNKYDTRPHPSLDESPKDAFNRGIANFGSRPFRVIPYDDNFIRRTLPMPRKGTSRIDPQRGVKINDIYYFNPIFSNPKYYDAEVERRYDPFNIGIAYVYLDNMWIECYSEYYSVFAGRSRKEIEIMSLERRQINISNGRSFAASAKELALLIQSNIEDEKLMRQRQMDREMNKVHAAMAAGRLALKAKNYSATQPTDVVRTITSKTDKSLTSPSRVFDQY